MQSKDKLTQVPSTHLSLSTWESGMFIEELEAKSTKLGRIARDIFFNTSVYQHRYGNDKPQKSATNLAVL